MPTPKSLNPKFSVLLYILLDTFCVGLGMGVPFFPILLGFPVGWYVTTCALSRRKTDTFDTSFSFNIYLRQIFKWSLFSSGLTFLEMLIIWLPSARMLFDHSADFANFGHPFILYDPKASFIAWLALMIFISPFLQLLTTIFSSFITLLIIGKTYGAKRAE